MDTSVNPLDTDFDLRVDGVPKVPDDNTWASPAVLELTYAQALLAPTALTLALATIVANFQSEELFPVVPFHFVGVEIP